MATRFVGQTAKSFRSQEETILKDTGSLFLSKKTF
jgi:hypothetical protein